MDFDVLIIGAGVTGSAIAMELAKTDLKIGVLEKEEDVCEGTSKANSAIVHAGYDARPGTLKAKLNVEGNRMIPQLAQQLDFDYEPNGSLVLCFDEADRPALMELYNRGLTNGVQGMEIWEKEQILEKEPHVSDQVVCALWAPTAGIVCPFRMNFAFAENAADNGVEFFFDTPAEKIEKIEGGWKINDRWTTRAVVNAAGLYADEIHNQVCPEKPIHITPRRGEYFLFDKSAGNLAHSTLFQLPTALGKGVLIAPTVHGNLLAGPTAENLESKNQTSTSAAGLDNVREKARITMENLPYNQVITSFSGLRAVPEGGDFIIEEAADGFFDAAGIESPGLTSAPAIGVMVADMVRNRLHPGERKNHISTRKGFIDVARLTPEEWNALILENPAYGNMICRCESVTEGSIIDACHRSIPCRTLDGLKRRVRAGAGRCQAGFCSPKSMEILSRELNIPMDQIQKSGKGSVIIVSRDKEDCAYDR